MHTVAGRTRVALTLRWTRWFPLGQCLNVRRTIFLPVDSARYRAFRWCESHYRLHLRETVNDPPDAHSQVRYRRMPHPPRRGPGPGRRRREPAITKAFGTMCAPPGSRSGRCTTRSDEKSLCVNGHSLRDSPSGTGYVHIGVSGAAPGPAGRFGERRWQVWHPRRSWKRHRDGGDGRVREVARRGCAEPPVAGPARRPRGHSDAAPARRFP